MKGMGKEYRKSRKKIKVLNRQRKGRKRVRD
jgi:hypothetical protein